MSYKKQIEKALLNNNWEIVAIDSNLFWWDDEHWKVQLKHNPDVHIFICFIVDPHFEDSRQKRQGILEIKAVSIFPENWNDDTHLIAKIEMVKGRFDEKLKLFFEQIENFKKENEKGIQRNFHR